MKNNFDKKKIFTSLVLATTVLGSVSFMNLDESSVAYAAKPKPKAVVTQQSKKGEMVPNTFPEPVVKAWGKEAKKTYPRLIPQYIKGTYSQPDKYADKYKYIVDESIGKVEHNGNYRFIFKVDEQKLIEQVKRESGKKEIKILRQSDLKTFVPYRHGNRETRAFVKFDENKKPVFKNISDMNWKEAHINKEEFLKFDLIILDGTIIKHPREIEYQGKKVLIFDSMETVEKVPSTNKSPIKQGTTHLSQAYDRNYLPMDFGSKYKLDFPAFWYNYKEIDRETFGDFTIGAWASFTAIVSDPITIFTPDKDNFIIEETGELWYADLNMNPNDTVKIVIK